MLISFILFELCKKEGYNPVLSSFEKFINLFDCDGKEREETVIGYC